MLQTVLHRLSTARAIAGLRSMEEKLDPDHRIEMPLLSIAPATVEGVSGRKIYRYGKHGVNTTSDAPSQSR
jgi:hypothetical protein